ncbi:MAG: tight adherence protein [Bryobacterales bacterium]|jgi:tight adherence protein C|nr:tight adherence protein [Bryobacterales bacterium]
MLILITFGLFAMLMIGISWFGHRRYVRPARVHVQLGAPVVTGVSRLELKTPQPKASVAILNRIGARLPSGRNASVNTQALGMAGYRSPHALQVFQGLRLVAVAVGFLLALLLHFGDSNPLMRILLLVGGAGIGWRIPGFLLKKRVAKRQSRLKLSLPDALDLIIVSVEAGLGLDQAIQYVAVELRDAHPELSEELQLIGLEMRAGLRRADALRLFAARTGEEEIQRLVGILVQNDRFGTSMGESLRTHSQYLRTRRKQDAEERAAKVGVKLVFPIFIFIMPSMMIVAAGPGLLQVFKYLFPMMKQIH